MALDIGVKLGCEELAIQVLVFLFGHVHGFVCKPAHGFLERGWHFAHT
jgi:hypothetical protein